MNQICIIDGCSEPCTVTINAPEGDPDPFEIYLCQKHANSVLADLNKELLDANTLRYDKRP